MYVPSLARLWDADVVHIFSGSYWSFLLAPVPAMIVGRCLNKHVVLNYHSGEADDHLSHWGPLVHPWLGLAHDLVVPSPYLRMVFAQHGYSARVVPNVVDVRVLSTTSVRRSGPGFSRPGISSRTTGSIS